MVSSKQIDRWAKLAVKAWFKRFNGVQRLFGEAQQKAFLAEEVMSIMLTIYEESGDRVLIGDMVAVYRTALTRLGFDEA